MRSNRLKKRDIWLTGLLLTLAALAIGYRLANNVAAREPAAPAAVAPLDDGQTAPGVTVPAGPFTLGLSAAELEQWAQRFGWQAGWFADETPAHTIELAAFTIDRFEVTNGRYAAFVAATGRRSPSGWPGGQPPTDQNDVPVTGVSWAEAQAFCQWAGGRLPTEAEWEKAARGTDGRLWPWGDQWAARHARTAEANNAGSAVPVGSYPLGASPYGAQDMAGNVWEWTASDYAAYHSAATPPTAGRFKVTRGGSWQYAADLARTTVRLGLTPGDRTADVGFRCIQEQ